jgi:hypothetical protein
MWIVDRADIETCVTLVVLAREGVCPLAHIARREPRSN